MKRPEFIARLARLPSGFLGRLLARLMAVETAPENDFALQLLELRPEDSVLELGFGHGKNLGRAAQMAGRGLVAGVDLSEDMCRMAARRNRRLVAQGRIEVKAADSRRIPYPDQHFAKAFSVNTIYFWPEPAEHLREIRRVLQRGGRLVLGFHARDHRVLADFPPSVYRFYSPDEVESLLRSTGYEQVRITRFPDPSRNFFFALAHRIS